MTSTRMNSNISMAKVIDVNLQSRHRNRWPTRKHLLEDVYHFSLDALDAKHDPALESLFLAVVSIEVHPNISGFTMLKRLALQYVKLVGDLPDLLSRCSLLEDLDISVCTGVGDLVIPCQLDKLQHLRIWGTEVQMIEFHVSCLTRFGYRGEAISIMLHGCPKSVKATIVFLELNQLDHVFTVLPSALPVKELSLDLHMYDYDLGQVCPFVPRNSSFGLPFCIFVCLLGRLPYHLFGCLSGSYIDKTTQHVYAFEASEV